MVNGKLSSAYDIVAGSRDMSSLSLAIQVDFDYFIPKYILHKNVRLSLERVTGVQQYFQQLRKLKDYDAKDAVAIGEAFMIKSKAEISNRWWKSPKHFEVRWSHTVYLHCF